MEVLRICPEQLKHEFHDILFNNTKHAVAVHRPLNSPSLSSDSTSSVHYEDYSTLRKVLSREDIESLQRIAKMLRRTDHFQDCVQMYITWRKDIVNIICGQLQKKMIKVKAIGTVSAYLWEEQREKIRSWIQMSRICSRNIFGEGKYLYKKVFGDGDAAAAKGYMLIIGDAAANLLEFPDSLMSSRPLPQKLEILLPLYQEFSQLMPLIDSLFPKEICLTKNIHDRASGIVCRLAKHMAGLLLASERHVLHELSTNPTPGGAIHPLTWYVMNYIDLIFTYKKSLTDLISKLEGLNDLSSTAALQYSSATENQDQNQITHLKHHLTRLIGFLLCNLGHKSRFYGHESLGHWFMMNNVHCIAQKIGNSQGLQEMTGYNYLMRLRNKVNESMTEYLETTWTGVVSCMRDERSKSQGKWASWPFGKSTGSVKEKLKIFNLMLENVRQRQEQWKVSDKQLRQTIHQSILVKLIPAYSQFLEQYNDQIDKFQHRKRYIKYSVKELERKILDMFLLQDLRMPQNAANATHYLKPVLAQNTA